MFGQPDRTTLRKIASRTAAGDCFCLDSQGENDWVGDAYHIAKDVLTRWKPLHTIRVPTQFNRCMRCGRDMGVVRCSLEDDTVTRNDQARQLFRDAFAGRISRREVMKRGAALGLSAMTLAALSQEATRSALAQDRQMVFTVYQ
jgi:hypothetical protein